MISLSLYNKYLTKNGMLDYLESILNKCLCNYNYLPSPLSIQLPLQNKILNKFINTFPKGVCKNPITLDKYNYNVISWLLKNNKEFNYSTNPSFATGSNGQLANQDFENDPRVYVTTVGLYNDANELLAVAKLSRPLEKSFHKEALLRVRLDF